MSQFDRALTGWRFVEIRWDDTLQAIAARELQDASRWADIANINGLAPPYLTADPTQAGPTVKLYGQMLIVPAGSPQVTAATDPAAVFGTDIALDRHGNLAINGADLGTVSGPDNLAQALANRVRTDKGELLFHLDYGCRVRQLLGAANGPTAGLLGAEYVKAACLADPRVSSVSSAKAQIQGDVDAITATAVAVSGVIVPVTTTV